MKILTKRIGAALRKRGYGNEYEHGDKVLFKLFNPVGRGIWYVMEGEEIIDDDGRADWRLFGLCGITFWEWGSVSLNELLDARLPFGLSIERDQYYAGTYGDLEEIKGWSPSQPLEKATSWEITA